MVNRQIEKWLQLVYHTAQFQAHFFIIHINGLLTSDVKLFADDTSQLSVVYNTSVSTSNLDTALAKIQDLTCKWKISFKTDPAKQAQEIAYSKKVNLSIHPSLLEVIQHRIIVSVLTSKQIASIAFMLIIKIYVRNSLNNRGCLIWDPVFCNGMCSQI